MGKVTLRPMRAVDMARISKVVLPRFFGVVVVQDGKDIGSGSVVWGDEGRVYLCLEITEELRQKPKLMVRAAQDLIKEATEQGITLYSVESAKEKTAPRFLAFLGFKPTEELKDGERVLKYG